MKIKINNNNLSTYELSYIGLNIAEHLVKSYEKSPNSMTLAAIIEEMEIIFNNFNDLEKDIKKHLGIVYDFTSYRNEIAHAKSLKSLLEQNQNIVTYFQENLLPIKQKMAADINNNNLCKISPSDRSALEEDIQSLYSKIAKKVQTIIPTKESYFQEATVEALLARYLLEKYPSSFEVKAFARLAVCCIREKYAILIDDKEELKKIFSDQDPFYEMLHIRRLFAHEKYPDLVGQNPNIFLGNLLSAVGITEEKYQKVKSKIESKKPITNKSKKEKPETKEVLNTKFSKLTIEETPEIDEESDNDNLSITPQAKPTNKNKKTKKKKKKVCNQEETEILDQAIEFNNKLIQLRQEEQKKLDAAFDTHRAFTISKQLSSLFVGIASLYQKIGIKDEYCIKGIPALEIKYKLMNKTLNSAKSLAEDRNKGYFHQRQMQSLVQLLEFAIKNISSGSVLIDKIIQKLAVEHITPLISNDFFDPNILISCDRLVAPSLKNPRTCEAYIIDFEVIAKESRVQDYLSASELSYLVPANPKLLEVVIAKGSLKAKHQLLKDLVFRLDIEQIEEFCKACLREKMNLKDLLNGNIMTIDGGDMVYNITPLEVIERKVIEELHLHHKSNKALEIKKHLHSIQILKKYGADINHHSENIKALNDWTFSNNKIMELHYHDLFYNAMNAFMAKNPELDILGDST
jgi:hypothetical protein